MPQGLRRVNARHCMVVICVSVLVLLAACSEEGSGDPSSTERIDPLLLDYLAPLNGDDWQAASIHFQEGLARVRATAIAPCLRDRGFAGQESALVVEARYQAMGNIVSLPALARMAKHGVSRERPAELTDDLSSALMGCSEGDGSKASRWRNEAERLLSEYRETVDERLSSLENAPVWQEAKDCMSDAGAPPFSNDLPDLEGIPVDAKTSAPGYQFYVDWVQSIEIQIILGQHTGPPGASEESRALGRCLTPFFDEVARSLEEPREEFVEEHREELVELQRRFASFDVAED
jgi:hypothetical protein